MYELRPNYVLFCATADLLYGKVDMKIQLIRPRVIKLYLKYENYA